MFGGQVAAQALRAASFTVPSDRPPHSLHAYFIRPGRPYSPMELVVERTRDGRSFATRHVTAVQADEAIFTMTTSFHVAEEGFDWQEQAPPAPEPGASLDLIRYGPFLVERMSQSSEVGAFHPCWVRLEEPIDPDPVMHACALTYISDYVGLGRRAVLDFAMLASLDHTVWFHRPVDINQWTLFCVEPMTSFGARGLARGTFHSRDRQLIASVVQEMLQRPAPAS